MDVIELWSGTTKAIIDPIGAWVTNLSDDAGDILFPKRQLKAPDGSTKTRGGCHVCLPNFGPGGDTGLAQHGFGRVAQWGVAGQNESSLTLRLVGGAEGYEALESTLAYELTATSIRMTLSVANIGAVPLRVGPAFHPYFALADGEGQVQIDGHSHDLDDLEGTLFETGEQRRLTSQRRTISLLSTGLSTWALWTDKLGPYVCVEPTMGGYTFLENEPTAEELLESGATKTYSAEIKW